METKMEELKMYHSTLGQGRHGDESLLRSSLFTTRSSISQNLIYQAGSFALPIHVSRIGPIVTSKWSHLPLSDVVNKIVPNILNMFCPVTMPSFYDHCKMSTVLTIFLHSEGKGHWEPWIILIFHALVFLSLSPESLIVLNYALLTIMLHKALKTAWKKKGSIKLRVNHLTYAWISLPTQ